MGDVIGLAKSAKALEESFFARENEKLLAKLRRQAQLQERRETLRTALNIDDDTVLAHLVDLDVSPEAVVAFSLVPLVWVAWADGEIQDAERAAVLKAADERGVKAGSVNHDLLQSWLLRKPEPVLVEAWRHHAKALHGSLTPEESAALRVQVMGTARRVAEAAGGILGLGSISAAERKTLEDLEAAFA
jgi:hypothetical protein